MSDPTTSFSVFPEPKPEPVANVVIREGLPYLVSNRDIKPTDKRLYTAPPQREWVGLTDEEMLTVAWQAGFDIHEDYDNEDGDMSNHWWTEDGEQCDETLFELRDLMNAKLKEKNT